MVSIKTWSAGSLGTALTSSMENVIDGDIVDDTHTMSLRDRLELLELAVARADPTYHVDRFANGADFTPVTSAGDFTVGGNFSLKRTGLITGVSFYTALTSAHTVKCSVWDGGGSLLATVDQAVSSSSTGVYSPTFASAITVASGDVGELYTVGVWEKSATNVVGHVVNSSGEPFSDGPCAYGLAYVAHSRMWSYSAGDAQPTTPGSSSTYGVDPIITIT